MIRILLFLFIYIPLTTQAQKTEHLTPVGKKDSIRQGASIIYGNFVQRLGFSSGGFPQDIIIRNISTGEVYAFRVKAAYKSAKENFFCFYLPPGDYMILDYCWTKSKWYGGIMYKEPIYKHDAPGNDDNSRRFKFTAKSGVITYLGTWKFDTQNVSFENAKKQLDALIKDRYQDLLFENATIDLPH